MAPRPTAERPPSGLDSYWTHVWDHALKVLKEQDTWAWELKPLLNEYVYALKGAADARDGFAWLEHLEESVASEDINWIVLQRIAGGLPTQWDRHTKRASALAETLLLTPAARRRHGLGTDSDEKPKRSSDRRARGAASRAELDDFAGFCAELTLEDGSALELHPFQRRMVADYFGGCTETLILVPKKNGKSTLLAALALYHLVVTPDAECVIAAASRDQAAIMLRQARGFIRRCRALQGLMEVKQREITSLVDDGRITGSRVGC